MNALVITLFPNRSAPSIRLLVDCDGAGCELKRKLLTGGEGAAGKSVADCEVTEVGMGVDCVVKAEEKSANSVFTGALVGTALDPKAELKSPKSGAAVSSARGSKSSIVSAEAAELKISSMMALLLFEAVAFDTTGTGSSPNKSSLCVLR